jgi:NAD(P)-dependent dehydrogenase (short-subunit alcohol dehydrogenase family)
MFHEKVIIITGSTGGIGLKTAEILSKRGACLVINSRSQEKVDRAVEKLQAINPHVIGIAGDVSQYAFCLELRDRTIRQFGRIDFLINNAGVSAGGHMQDMVPEAFTCVININLLGSVFPTLACLDDIRRQKGGILFVSSVAGIVGLPNYAPYAASKRALVSVAESLKTELSGQGVFVGVNYPGFTENEAGKTTINAKGEKVLLQKRDGIHINSLDKTAYSIVDQLELRRFRAYSDMRAVFVQGMYRYLPQLTLWILRQQREKIMSMQ